MSDGSAERAVERAARESYGRLLAYFAARWRDVAAVEDALSESLVAALEAWPRDGVPDRPEAWLLQVARNRLVDGSRRVRLREERMASLRALREATDSANGAGLPDERLRLLFVCAHPAIDPSARTALMLQTVLGLDAARIASAFLVSPAAMGARLVRAKAKIRAAGIPFDLDPSGTEWERRGPVLDAVYAAYGTGWNRGSDSGLALEATWLGRALAQTLPDEPEAWGLLALMLFAESRRPARRGPRGEFVALPDQDPALWDASLLAEAEGALRRAAGFARPGRYGLEAAIQAVHAERRRTGKVEWQALVRLYEGLVGVAPSIGAALGRAAARAETLGAREGLASLEALAEAGVAGHQPYWALRASLLARVGEVEAAADAYRRAEGLSEDPAVRRFLAARRGTLE